MKKNHLMKTIKILLLLFFIPFFGISQTTIFTENFGTTPSGNPLVTVYTGYQNYGVQRYTGSADVRTTSASSTYVGASGGANVFIKNTANTSLVISGINTLNYNTLTLSLGLNKSTTASNGSELGIQVSVDSLVWTDLVFTMTTGTGSAVWTSITPTGTIPATSNLKIRFIMKSVSGSLTFRVDDIKLTGIQNIILP